MTFGFFLIKGMRGNKTIVICPLNSFFVLEISKLADFIE